MALWIIVIAVVTVLALVTISAFSTVARSVRITPQQLEIRGYSRKEAEALTEYWLREVSGKRPAQPAAVSSSPLERAALRAFGTEPRP